MAEQYRLASEKQNQDPTSAENPIEVQEINERAKTEAQPQAIEELKSEVEVAQVEDLVSGALVAEKDVNSRPQESETAKHEAQEEEMNGEPKLQAAVEEQEVGSLTGVLVGPPHELVPVLVLHHCTVVENPPVVFRRPAAREILVGNI